MDHLTDLLSAVRNNVDHELPQYTDSLTAAFNSTDPVFVRDKYAEFFWHCASTVPGWLPQVLLANAEAESHGSAKLLSLWQTVDYNAEVERKILVHAKDESRHSRIFLTLTDLAFSSSVAPDLIDHMKSSLPDVRRQPHEKIDKRLGEDALIDALVQMNIGEIRTRIHLQFFAPIIYALTPSDEKRKVERLLQGLARDEVRHIAYTARLMEEWAINGGAQVVRDLYSQRLQDFNLITIHQTEASVRAFGRGQFPSLLEV